MQTGLKMQTVVFAILFCAISMGGMLFFARNKAIEIDNVAQDQVVNGIGFADIMQEAAGSLRFRQTEETTEYLCIPLENGVKAEEVTIENHYMEKQVWVYIKDTTAEFYAKEAIFGNLEGITEGIYEHAGGTTLIKFTLAEVYECKSVLEEGYLYIDFVLPGEVYDRIVVIDAGFGGTDNGVTANGLIEKDINLDIIKRVKELLDNSGIKVYYTRTTDVDIAPEDRIALANDTDADMFISVQLNTSEDISLYGAEAFYNGSYYIPGFGSIELADTVERAVVTEISTRGNGLSAAGEDDILLQNAEVPAAVIKVGYASNEQEAALLQQETYREKIALGLYNAILAAYEINGH